MGLTGDKAAVNQIDLYFKNYGKAMEAFDSFDYFVQNEWVFKSEKILDMFSKMSPEE